MKKVVRILLAILMVACLALTVTACKNDCAKGNHSFSVLVDTDEATCTAPKTLHYKCANCDATHDVEEGEPLGHDPAATWTAQGNKHYHACSRCDAHLDEADHTPVKMDGTPATCFDTGLTDGSKCSVCQEILSAQQTIELAKHSYDEGVITTEATCHTKGVKTFTCSVCPAGTKGHTKTEEVDFDATNHDGTTAWTEDGDLHKLVCSGCNATLSSHEADMTDWTVLSGQHTQSCQETGCTVSHSHTANFASAWTEEGGKHFHVCQDCTLHADDEHNANYATSWSDEDGQHFHACMREGCDLRADVGDHNSNGVIKAVDATCIDHGWTAGKKCDVCDKVMEAPVQTNPLGHNYVYDNNETDDEHHVGICSRCNDRINDGAHTWVWHTEDKDLHWEECSLCKRIKGEKTAHQYENGFTCECGRVVTGVKFATFYNGHYTRFDTLPEAVASITDNSEAVIFMGDDLSGNGVFVPSDRNITFRFNGHTYTVTGGAVGSVNFKSQAFHLEKNSFIKMMNGTITSTASSGVKMLVQNYSNLTLENIVLDGTNLDANNEDAPRYTMSNNFGNTVLKNTTINFANDNGVAFDVWYGMNGTYLEGVSVTVKEGCQINGVIEYGAETTPDNFDKVVLALHGGRVYTVRFSSDNVNCDNCNVTIGGEKLAHNYVKQSTTDATCTEAQIDHYVCSHCGKIDDRTVGEPNGHTPSDVLSHENGQHYHKCTVCGKDADERVDCTYTAGSYEKDGDKHWQVCICGGTSAKQDHVYGDWSVLKESTCTVNGTQKHSCICGHEETAELELKAHEYQEAWTTSVTEHWHKCANCDAKENVAQHSYDKNVCSTCGKTLTEAELIALIDTFTNTSKDTQYLLGTGNNGTIAGSTFMLTGVYKGGTGTKGNYILSYANETKEIIAYDLKVTDLEVGDIITVWGAIKNYKGTIEFELKTASTNSLGFGQEFVKHGDVTITLEKDDNQVEVNGLPQTVERLSNVEFTVTAKDGFRIESVKVNGLKLIGNDGLYTFTITADTKIVIESVSADTPYKHSFENTELITVNDLEVTGSYNKTQEGTSSKLLGTTEVQFGWKSVMKGNQSFQMNYTIRDATGDFAHSNLYNKTELPFTLSKIKLTFYNSNKNVMVVVSTTADFAVSEELQNNNDIYVVPSDKDYRFFKIMSVSGSATYIVKIELISEGDCAMGEAIVHEAKAATCTENGNIAYYECPTCHKLFKEENFATETTLEAVTLKATGHHLVAVDRLSPTCTEDGYEAYWRCDNANCGCLFSDAEGKTALDEVVVIGAIGHDYIYTSNGDGTHNIICRNNTSHNQSNVACTPENANEWDHDADGHWQVCALCNEPIKVDPHTFADGKCSVCNRPENVAPIELVWEVTIDGDKVADTDLKNYIPEAVGETTSSSFSFAITLENKNDYIITVVNMSVSDSAEETLGLINDQYTFTVDEEGNIITVTIVSKVKVSVSVTEAEKANATIGLADSAEATAWADNIAIPQDGTVYIKAIPNDGFEVAVSAADADGKALTVGDGTDGIYSIANLPKGTVTVTVKVTQKASETTIEKKSFTAVSGKLDDNVSYSTAKGGGTSNPAVNSGEIRLYQNSSGTGGGTITISVPSGKKITSITIGSSMATSIAYTIGSETKKSENKSISANGTVLLDNFGEDVTSVTIHCMGADKKSRLYVNYLSVTYA